ncbi:hypothetical protein ACVDG5_033680 [Mesorhizobium sp. ORM6]
MAAINARKSHRLQVAGKETIGPSLQPRRTIFSIRTGKLMMI